MGLVRCALWGGGGLHHCAANERLELPRSVPHMHISALLLAALARQARTRDWFWSPWSLDPRRALAATCTVPRHI